MLLWVSGSKYFVREDRPAWLLRLLFGIKVLLALAFFGMYTFYYQDRSTADMYKYYDDAVVLFRCAKEQPASFIHIISGDLRSSTDSLYFNQMNHWKLGYSRLFENNHRQMIWFNLILMPVSQQNILVHCLVMCFLSFMGLLWIHTFLSEQLPHKSRLLLLSLFMLPGPMFWTSALLKESLVVFYLGICLLILRKQQKTWMYMILALALILLFQLKTYFALAMVFPLGVMLLDAVVGNKRRGLMYGIMTFVFLLMAIGLNFLPEAYNPWLSLTQKLNGFREVNAANPAASGYDLGLSDSPVMWEWLIKLPAALLTGICRPMLWEARSPVVGLSASDFIFWMAGLFTVWIGRRRTATKENLSVQERKVSTLVVS